MGRKQVAFLGRRGGYSLRVAVAVAVLALAASAVAGPIDDLVSRVSQDKYTTWMQDYLYTHYRGPGDYDNRGLTGAQHDLARNNIFNFFSGLGLNTRLHGFTYLGKTYYNVIGVHTGLVRPESIYLLGAHYDSFNNPGADDNASGVAGVMEAARVLSQYSFESTLVFAAFDCEEHGLHGSYAYAKDHKDDDIRGMISLDMIAYNPPGANYNKARIYYAVNNSPITTALQDALIQYGGITATIGKMGRSDHEPFDNRGFDACLLIEYSWSTNPHYHKITDAVETVGLIDYDYATRMTRGAVGYLATHAVLLAVPEPVGSGYIVVLAIFLRRVLRRRQ